MQSGLKSPDGLLSNYSLTRKPCERCGTKRSCADEITLLPKLCVIWRCRVCINARRRMARENFDQTREPEVAE